MIQNSLYHSGVHKKVLVFPHYPSRGSTLYKILRRLHYTITNKASANFSCAVYWEYLTERKEYAFLEPFVEKHPVVNFNSRDISKVYVDTVFTNVFGYSTCVNPTEYSGSIVQKSDTNALHDGVILQGPLQKIVDGSVYQILIDNRYSSDLVVDMRVVVVRNILPFVYIKYRDISERFKNTTVKTEVRQTIEVLSEQEIELLQTFCNNIHIDFGELDVLRNNDDGKVYVVDVNNTPQGPPAHTSKKDAEYALDTIAKAFQEEFLPNKS
ncbi:MAG: hypothetical protein PF481_07780 [Bacteroidales bacterium]|nr:hypothetical protein [Bacteroidales bacterium]